jgi:hypothetical protein
VDTVVRVHKGHHLRLLTLRTHGQNRTLTEIPLYKLFYDGKGEAKKLDLPTTKKDGALWGAKGKAHRELRLFAKALSRMNDKKRKLLLNMAQTMATHSKA